MVANPNIIGMKTPSGQKSEGVLFYPFCPTQTNYRPKGHTFLLKDGICKSIDCVAVVAMKIYQQGVLLAKDDIDDDSHNKYQRYEAS